MTASHYLVVILALAGANLPFLTQRVFLVRPAPVGGKSFWWRLLELVTIYLLIGGLAIALESQAHGAPYPQHWEFYWTTAFLFLVFAFPGFAIRYLWRHRGN